MMVVVVENFASLKKGRIVHSTIDRKSSFIPHNASLIRVLNALICHSLPAQHKGIFSVVAGNLNIVELTIHRNWTHLEGEKFMMQMFFA